MNPIMISNHTCCQSSKSPRRLFTILGAASLLLIASLTSSCETTKGVGRDIEHGGEHIQKAASH